MDVLTVEAKADGVHGNGVADGDGIAAAFKQDAATEMSGQPGGLGVDEVVALNDDAREAADDDAVTFVVNVGAVGEDIEDAVVPDVDAFTGDVHAVTEGKVGCCTAIGADGVDAVAADDGAGTLDLDAEKGGVPNLNVFHEVSAGFVGAFEINAAEEVLEDAVADGDVFPAVGEDAGGLVCQAIGEHGGDGTAAQVQANVIGFDGDGCAEAFVGEGAERA